MTNIILFIAGVLIPLISWVLVDLGAMKRKRKVNNMAHQHEKDELVTLFFVAQENSDLTEGRGTLCDIATFTSHEDAYNKVKGRAVQGCGDGDVVKRSYYRCTTCPELIKVDERIYVGDAYCKKNLLGKRGYADFLKDGWRKDYSPMGSDPEFEEFLRLSKKFQDIQNW